MLEYMKKVVDFKGELNVEERNLLSVAYKNTVGSRRFLIIYAEQLGDQFRQLNKKKKVKEAKI